MFRQYLADPLPRLEQRPAPFRYIIIRGLTALPHRWILSRTDAAVRDVRKTLEQDLQRVRGKLGNEKFLANAPAEVVEKEQAKLEVLGCHPQQDNDDR